MVNVEEIGTAIISVVIILAFAPAIIQLASAIQSPIPYFFPIVSLGIIILLLGAVLSAFKK